MALQRRRPSGSDDGGFDDFLSEDEEECALQTQEMAALARKMKTVGVRDAIEFGKEASLQEGFDEGFAMAARQAFRFSALRGTLCAALASGLSSALEPSETEELTTCVEALRVRSLRVPRVATTAPETIVDGAAAAADASTAELAGDAAADESLIERAVAWTRRLQLPVENAIRARE